MEEKVILRNRFLKLRSALNPVQVKAWSESIKEKVTNLKEFEKARMICCYLSFRKEVQTDEIIRHTLNSGKRVSVPVIKDNGNFFVSEIEDIERQLCEGKFGIRQPKEEFIKKVNPDEIDLIFVPGVVFDLKGQRLGWGRGYYDRCLSKLTKETFLVGLAYDFQVIRRLPSKKYDILMGKIITEKRIILVKSS